VDVCVSKPDVYDILTSLDQTFFNLNRISDIIMYSVFLIKPRRHKTFLQQCTSWIVTIAIFNTRHSTVYQYHVSMLPYVKLNLLNSVSIATKCSVKSH